MTCTRCREDNNPQYACCVNCGLENKDIHAVGIYNDADNYSVDPHINVDGDGHYKLDFWMEKILFGN